MPRQPSLLSRSLEPLIQTLWPLFVGWSIFTAGLWWTGDAWVENVGHPGLRAALGFIVDSADAAWLLLAALNLYLDLAAREGIARARTVALTVFAIATAIAWTSASTGYPLGQVAYTTQLGARLGPVPLGWPLLWFVVVIGGRTFISRIWPRGSHTAVSVAVGGVALLTDASLEPLAVKLRLYWFWYATGTTVPSTPSWSNYGVWFLASAALAWVAREQNVATTQPRNTRAASVILIVHAVFLAGHLRGLVAG